MQKLVNMGRAKSLDNDMLRHATSAERDSKSRPARSFNALRARHQPHRPCRGGRPSSEVAEEIADLSGTSQAPSTAQARPRPRAELRPQPRKWPARFRGLAGPRAASPLDEHCLTVDPAAQLHTADEV